MRCRESVRIGRLHEAWSASVDTKAKHFSPQVKFVFAALARLSRHVGPTVHLSRNRFIVAERGNLGKNYGVLRLTSLDPCS